MKKSVSILYPKEEFTPEQLQKLQFVEKVSFVDKKNETSLKDLIKLSKEADVLAFSPDKFGKLASKYLFEILEASSNVKRLVLNSADSDYVDKEYLLKRGISLAVVIPDPAVEAIAEYVMLLILNCARNMFDNKWQAQKRNYPQELGFELLGKTLGIIGINATSERIVKLAKPFGLRIIFCDDKMWRIEDAERQSLERVISMSDFVVLNLPNNEENNKFFSKERIGWLKEESVLINLSNRNLVDEKWVAESLKNKQISKYLFETEAIKSSTFDNIEGTIALKQLSRYTQDSMNKSRNVWVTNIASSGGVSTS